MTLKKVQDLMSHGLYPEAMEIIESEPKNIRYAICKSRIKELNGQFDEAISIARSSLNNAIMKFDNIATIEAITALAYGMWRVFNFEGGLNYITQASDYISSDEENIDYKSAIGSLHNIHGLILWKNKNLDEALTEFSNGLNYRKDVGDNSPISYSLNNMGNTYLSMGHVDFGRKYYQEALDIRLQHKTKPGIASSYNSFGRLYDNLGDFEQALEYHEKSLSLWEEVGNHQFIAKGYRFLGTHYLMQRDVEKANSYLKKALDLFQTIQNKIDYEITKNLLPSRT